MAPLLLGSATRSVLDFVRTERRTVRLPIACGDRSNEAMHPSQVAGGGVCVPFRGARMGEGLVSASLGGRVKNERAVGS